MKSKFILGMMPRREFLRNSAILSMPVMFGGIPLPALGYTPPKRTRGSTIINVKNKGAVGNGSHDDTTAFQKAIDALPPSGGTVYVPSGTYLIDPVRSIRLRSKMHLQLASNAKLLAKANNKEKSYVVYAYKVSDIEISGGQIEGDRYKHLGTTGEWGHGIQIRGSSRVTIRDMRIFDCWGDGVCIGPALVWKAPSIKSNDVVISNIICTRNRRQGLSIGAATNVKVYDSEFSNTYGTAPQCGIDIEPDVPDIAYKIDIVRCLIRNNKTYGLLIFKRAQGVTVRECVIEKNGSCGLVTVGCIATYIVYNTIRNNSATGLLINSGTDNCQVSRNTFKNNYTRNGNQTRQPFTLTGWTRKIERDILIREPSTDIRITTNYYR